MRVTCLPCCSVTAKSRGLDVGGTVVGLFSPMTYEQAEVQIQPGDLLVAFTDGITEPENIYGEEFGEERLLQVVRRAQSVSAQTLMEEIYRSVSDWTGSPELQDDMTMLVARRRSEGESRVKSRRVETPNVDLLGLST